MKNKIRNAVGILTILVLTGCASIISKSRYPIQISSEPDNARVTITRSNGQTVFTGKTPAYTQLDAHKGYFRRERYLITFQKEGYETVIQPIDTRIDGWYWGNLVFGGFLGFVVVDPLTGAMFKLDQKFIHTKLFEVESSTSNLSPH